MALTLTVGSGSIAFVQKSVFGGSGFTITNNDGDLVPMVLPAPSTAGTTLIAVVGGHSVGLQARIASFPMGWIKLIAQTQSTDTDLEIWAYLNNPGGISTVNPAVKYSLNGAANWFAEISEWSSVRSASALEASGGASTSAGTTLTPVATSSVLSQGDLAIAAWFQWTGIGGTVTFTTPAGFINLSDNGATAAVAHLDVEYQLNPPVGAFLQPTLTSTVATVSAAGAIVVLTAAPPVQDQTVWIEYDSMAVKLNTFDFGLMLGGKLQLEDGSGYYQLEDGSGVYLMDSVTPSLGDPVTLTNPAWTGRVVSVGATDLTDLITNYKRVRITATNTTAAPGGSPPGPLSDAPTGGYYQLEDASGDYQLEDGSGNYLLESTTFGYRRLSVQTSQNQDGTTTTYGSLETFEAGFAAGMTFLLTSTNLQYASQAFTISNVNISFLHTTPLYLIEFGDAYSTLQLAGGGILTQQASTAAIQSGIAVPAGTLSQAKSTTLQSGIGAAETDLTSLTVSVTVASGRRITVKGYIRYTQNTITGTATCAISENGSDLTAAVLTLAAGGQGILSPEIPLTPTAGAHTYKLTLKTSAGTADVNNDQSTGFILVEDVGT